MARIIYSGLVTSIRGSIGGTTFQNNAYGFTIKNKASMIRPNSIDQEVRKIIFSSAVKNWSTMSQTGRDNWNTFAASFPQFSKHNVSSVLSGFAVFVKWHAANYLRTGLYAAVDSVPSVSPVAMDSATLTLVNAAGVLTLNSTWAIGDESWNVNIFMSRGFSAAQNFVGTSPKFIVGVQSIDAATVVTSAYIAKFGALPLVGSFVNVALQLYDENGGKVLATSVQRITVT
jgi:hypothetical protein